MEFLQLHFRPMANAFRIFFHRCLFLISDYIKYMQSAVMNSDRAFSFTIKAVSLFFLIFVSE